MSCETHPSEKPSVAPSISIGPTASPTKDAPATPTSTSSSSPTDLTPSTTASPTKHGPGTPTSTLSSSPTDVCEDDESYISPVVLNMGCELYDSPSFDCYSFENVMTPQQIQELLARCPKTCGVSCETHPSMKQTVGPSSYPTVSVIPSSRPSLSPSECVDDESYQTPFNSNVGCTFFENAKYDCHAMNLLLSEAEINDLFARCPVSCKSPCV